jgi:hypothetical protein
LALLLADGKKYDVSRTNVNFNYFRLLFVGAADGKSKLRDIIATVCMHAFVHRRCGMESSFVFHVTDDQEKLQRTERLKIEPCT